MNIDSWRQATAQVSDELIKAARNRQSDPATYGRADGLLHVIEMIGYSEEHPESMTEDYFRAGLKIINDAKERKRPCLANLANVPMPLVGEQGLAYLRGMFGAYEESLALFGAALTTNNEGVCAG